LFSVNFILTSSPAFLLLIFCLVDLSIDENQHTVWVVFQVDFPVPTVTAREAPAVMIGLQARLKECIIILIYRRSDIQ
uniref:Uncharacterized protein n=1 Tax=Oryctolagus cuniculus TaxID=9986 RepID=A0A5F9D7S6_RABIT